MKTNINKILLVVVLALITYHLSLSACFAAFKDCGWGTRPAGMGGAFVGVANDSNAPLWNPAGIAQMKNAESSFMYSTYYNGLDLKAGSDSISLGFNYLSFVYPKSSIGAFGVSWANFTATDLYKEDTYTLTYAKKINDWFPNLPPIIYVGLNLKSLGYSWTLDEYAKSDPLFVENGISKSDFTADIGALIKPWNRLAIGLAGKNLTQPVIGLAGEEKVPMELKVGVAYRYTLITPAVDLTMRDGVSTMHVGLESYLFRRTLGLRAGWNSTELTFGFSFNGIRSDSFGVNLDYSFIMPMQIEDSSGSHRVSMGVWF